jgi:GT2 family glycosyltransferase
VRGDARTTEARIGVVIATRDRRDSLLRTLELLTSLPERPPIVVVDNASGDGTPAAVAAGFPEVELLALERNHGAAARNVGVRHLETPFVAFSDDDSWWDAGALARAAQILESQPALALVAARILVGEERRLDPVSDEMRSAPTPADLPGPRIDGFLACGAVVRAAAFLAAGGFCERFLIGAEEELLTIDLRAAGWELCYADRVVAVHAPQRSGRGNRSRLERRNELWTSWLRRPARRALRETAELALCALRDAAALRAFAGALVGLPWALSERRAPRIPSGSAGRGDVNEEPREKEATCSSA